LKAITTSKIILLGIFLLTTFVVIFSCRQMILLQTYEPLLYLIPAVFTELAAATASYYWKAKNENKIKIILGAVERFQKNNPELTEPQVRIIEAMINSLS